MDMLVSLVKTVIYPKYTIKIAEYPKLKYSPELGVNCTQFKGDSSLSHVLSVIRNLDDKRNSYS